MDSHELLNEVSTVPLPIKFSLTDLISGGSWLLAAVVAFIGFCILFKAMIRLRRHSAGMQMMHYVSPVSTSFHFLSGAMLVSFIPFVEMLNQTFFADEQMSSFQNSILFYSANIPEVQSYLTTKDAAFLALTVVGVISISRALILLIRTGDGQQEGLGRCIAHLIAGIVGVNAISVFQFLGIVN
ncbi:MULTISPECIES: hypothetical protein [Cysteiniphilum]|uniref:hypothetical protein n=1 Tax=Cysteiniphilum TaxID=2056696 RepID=UPI0017812BB0|nr:MULTISPECIES: hypothetical protein [Cysteiniphilum]